MKRFYLNRHQRALFGIFVLIIFSDYFLKLFKIEPWFGIAGALLLTLKYFFFMPITLFLGLGFLIGLFFCGDCTFLLPGWKLVADIIGLGYAYYLARRLTEEKTRYKHFKWMIVLGILYTLLMGTLFLIWQTNPYLYEKLNFYQSYKIYGLTSAILYLAGLGLLIYWWRILRKI